MATQTSLVIIAGRTQRLTATDTLGVGSGINSQGGNHLTLTSAGTNIVVNATNLVAASDNTTAVGSSALRFTSVNGVQFVARADATDTSKSVLTATGLTGTNSGTFTVAAGTAQALTLTGNAASAWGTSSGTLTINGAGGLNLQGGGVTALAINASGTAITVQAGAVLGTTGTGNINLPSNGTARFRIEGVAVTAATITAANFDKLFDGSDVGSLHTHAGLSASNLVQGGLTVTALSSLGTGYFGYVSAADTLAPTDADTEAATRMFGVYTGTAASATVAGVVTVRMTTAGGDPGNGGPVYLAPATEEASAAGKGTATAPAGPGKWVAEVGICLDNGNYAGSKTVEMLIQPKTVVGV